VLVKTGLKRWERTSGQTELPKVDGHSPFPSSVVRDRVEWQKASLKDQSVVSV